VLNTALLLELARHRWAYDRAARAPLRDGRGAVDRGVGFKDGREAAGLAEQEQLVAAALRVSARRDQQVQRAVAVEIALGDALD
jgi:hypothetical protein